MPEWVWRQSSGWEALTDRSSSLGDGTKVLVESDKVMALFHGLNLDCSMLGRMLAVSISQAGGEKETVR